MKEQRASFLIIQKEKKGNKKQERAISPTTPSMLLKNIKLLIYNRNSMNLSHGMLVLDAFPA
jgi:hypothetical protein